MNKLCQGFFHIFDNKKKPVVFIIIEHKAKNILKVNAEVNINPVESLYLNPCSEYDQQNYILVLMIQIDLTLPKFYYL